MALEYKYKRICRSCWKVIPDGKHGFFGNIPMKHSISYTSSIFINNEWLCCVMCERCYQVKHPLEYKFLKDSSIKQGKKKRLSVLYPLYIGRKF